jgi:hypothetical protein
LKRTEESSIREAGSGRVPATGGRGEAVVRAELPIA